MAPYSIDEPLVMFSSTDNIAIDYCEITYLPDDGVVGTTGSFITQTHTSPVQLSLDPDMDLHEVTVTCYDTAGNSSSNTIKFPPIIEFTVPTPISNVAITNATVTITSPQ